MDVSSGNQPCSFEQAVIGGLINMEGYRSGHNEAVLKTVWVSKPTRVRIPHLPPYWGVAKR